MKPNSNNHTEYGAHISVEIPLRDERLFKSSATDDILLFLIRNRDESFSITDIAEAVDYSRPAVTKAVDVLSQNELVVEGRDGQRRLIQINRNRLILPDDPFLEIPQAEFHAPVKTATEELVDELDDVLAVVLYGSVARGEADRRSDIDLWVLVRENRMENQRQANRVRQSLEDEAFEGDRYDFEIDVEGLHGIPNYTGEIQEILSDAITLYATDEFDTVRNMIIHGDVNE